MANSLDSISKLVSSSYLGWCGADPNKFYSATEWSNRVPAHDELTLRKLVLGKLLLNNLVCITRDETKYLAREYVFACGTIADVLCERDEINDVESEPLATQIAEVLTLLSGRVLIYTPIDCFTFIRDQDSTITRSQAIQVKILLRHISSHPTYYRIRPDELAVGAIFYCRLAAGDDVNVGLVLAKKNYRYQFFDYLSIVQIIYGMILQTPRVEQLLPSVLDYVPLDITPDHLSSNLTVPSADAFTVMKDGCGTSSKSTSLGSGTYGQVSKTRVGRVAVAVKKQEWSGAAIRELAVMTTLSHSNIQSARSFCIEGEKLNIYMTIQRSLFSLIYSSHPYGAADALGDQTWIEGNPSPFKLIDLLLRRSYARQLLQGLAYLHDVGILHGDIKPDNLLISQADVLKIADFGLSFLYCTSRRYSETISMLLYAPGYRDPIIDEKMKVISYETDIWAAAITILEMETGVIPQFSKKGNLNMDCIQDRRLSLVCSQMLLREQDVRITARQALIFFE